MYYDNNNNNNNNHISIPPSVVTSEIVHVFACQKLKLPSVIRCLLAENAGAHGYEYTREICTL